MNRTGDRIHSTGLSGLEMAYSDRGGGTDTGMWVSSVQDTHTITPSPIHTQLFSFSFLVLYSPFGGDNV